MTTARVWRSAGGVTLITLLSRLAGYLRDKVMAYVMGAGFYSDAFIVAFRIPNMLRGLFAEGALHAAFIPLFSEMRRTRPAEVWHFAARVFYCLTLVTSGVTVLGIVCSPGLVALMAGDFPPDKAALTVLLNRVMFPYLAFISLAGLLQGILNVLGRFYLSASTPIFLNAAIVACGVGLAPVLGNPAAAFAAGALLGGFLQFFLQLVLAMRLGFSLALPRPFWAPEVGQLLRALLPGVFALGVYEISQLVGTRFAASAGDASVTYLYYSYRLVHLVYGGFIVSLFTVLLPALSESVADRPKFNAGLASGFHAGLFITLPAVTGLSILSVPIIRLLFEGGRFTPEDTPRVAWALVGYAFSLVPYAVTKLLTAAFFAHKDTRLPAWAAAVNLGVFTLGCFLLVPRWGHLGVAWATSLGGFAQWGFLAALLRRHVPEYDHGGFLRDLALQSAINLPFAVLLYAAAKGLGLFGPMAVLPLVLRLAACIGGFAALYLGTGLALRVRAAGHILEMAGLRKR
jgi:putative peptidoglycan lipid II flippase